MQFEIETNVMVSQKQMVTLKCPSFFKDDFLTRKYLAVYSAEKTVAILGMGTDWIAVKLSSYKDSIKLNLEQRTVEINEQEFNEALSEAKERIFWVGTDRQNILVTPLSYEHA